MARRGSAAALAEALTEFADLPAERRRAMGARAAETIRARFHADDMVRAYRRLYRELLGR